MTVLVCTVAFLLTVVASGILAKILSREKPVTWVDKEFQIWAFGEVLPEKMPLRHVVSLWNRRNPENRISSGDDYARAISEMLSIYNDHRK